MRHAERDSLRPSGGFSTLLCNIMTQNYPNLSVRGRLKLTIMKKTILSLAVVAMGLASCSTTTTTSTATTLDVPTRVESINEADLVVSDQVITYTYTPTKEVQKGGLKNVRNAAIAEALKANGSGDVLVHPNFQITMKVRPCRKTVSKVVVTGHVGTYKNFRPAPKKPCCKK